MNYFLEFIQLCLYNDCIECVKDTMILNKHNRIKSKQPLTDGEFWCWKCDRCVVSQGRKCRECGALNGNATRKKQEVVDFDLEFADPKLYNDCIE